jgi:hypothetical protein
MIPRKLVGIAILGISAASAGCVAEVGSVTDVEAEEAVDVASSVQPLIQAGTAWPGGWVPVCYKLPTGLSQADRTKYLASWERARQAVEDNWQRVANINFTGWGACGNDVRGHLAVNLVGSGTSFSQVGYRGASSTTSMTLNVNRSVVTVLHEFGHALGFAHEFDHSDWSGPCMQCDDDADCSSSDGKVCLPSGYCGHTTDGNVELTPADRDSVMSATYCSGWADSNGEISPWDAIGVQRLYGKKHHGSIVGLGGRCLNIAGGTAEWGKNYVAWPCVGAENDTFTFVRNSNEKFMLRSTVQGSNLCANVHGGVVSPSTGTPITSWGCVSTAANEQFEPIGMQLRAMGKMCVVATGTTAGSKLELQHCGEAPAARERWDIVGRSLRLSGTNQCISVPGVNSPLGTEPTLATCSGSTNTQGFTLTAGEIRKGSLCFNVFGGLPTPGSRVGLWDGCGGGHDNEYFYATGTLRSLGQCMDMFGGVSFDGAQVGVYPCAAGAPNEQWDYHWK